MSYSPYVPQPDPEPVDSTPALERVLIWVECWWKFLGHAFICATFAIISVTALIAPPGSTIAIVIGFAAGVLGVIGMATAWCMYTVDRKRRTLMLALAVTVFMSLVWVAEALWLATR